MRKLLIIIGGMALIWVCAHSVALAQAHAYDVFVRLSQERTQLEFADVRTGLSVVVTTDGRKHTLARRGVLFETDEGVRIAYPDGQVGLFALIPAAGERQAVDWVVSANGTWIAWGVIVPRGEGVVSELFIADTDGGARRSVLFTSSTQQVGVIPVAVSDDGGAIFYARIGEPFGERSTPLTVDQVFRLNTQSGESAALPEITGCPCPVGFTPDGRWFARLVADEAGSYTLRVWNVDSGAEGDSEATVRGLEQAGGIFLQPETGQALFFAGRRVSGRWEYTLYLADLGSGALQALATGLRGMVRPLGISREGMVTFVGVERDGTFKVLRTGGDVVTVSSLTYLGQLP